MESPAKVFAAVLGLTAFAVAVTAGLFAGSPGGEVLSRAMLSMAACYPLGLLLGAAAGRAIDEHIRSHRERHPLTDLSKILDSYVIEVDEA